MRLESISERIRTAFDARSAARDRTLVLSREIIRTSANTIRAAHRGELDRAREMLRGAHEAVAQMRAALAEHPDIYHAGYVHDCQKEHAEAAGFLAIISGEELPEPEQLGVEFPAYLNGLGETIGELRRYALDRLRVGELARAEAILGAMDEIYYVLVTIDYPDALTGGLRRTTDSARGIIEKTRGELTVALRQEELRRAIRDALSVLRPDTVDLAEPPEGDA
ncbi:MAG: Translin [Armatimonadetes bacterium]|jgi:translin|nr:Translin [Armatimonadota bacterium]